MIKILILFLSMTTILIYNSKILSMEQAPKNYIKYMPNEIKLRILKQVIIPYIKNCNNIFQIIEYITVSLKNLHLVNHDFKLFIKDIVKETKKRLKKYYKNENLNLNEANKVLNKIEKDNNYSKEIEPQLVTMILLGNDNLLKDLLFLISKKINLINFVKLIICYSKNINVQDLNGFTPLMYACENGNIELANELINRKAEINIKNKEEKIALFIAIENNNLELVNLLLNNKSMVNIQTASIKYTPLMKAVEKGNEEVVKLLLKHQANVNEQNIHGKTALIIAVEKNNINLVKLLLDNKANPDIYSHTLNCNALNYASKHGYEEIVRLLLQYNAAIDPQDTSLSYTPLMYAARNNYHNILAMLLKYKANVNLINRFGKTAKDIALSNKHTNIIQLIDNYIKEQSKPSSPEFN